MAQRNSNRLRACGDASLWLDAIDMRADGLVADGKDLADFPVALARRNPGGHCAGGEGGRDNLECRLQSRSCMRSNGFQAGIVGRAAVPRAGSRTCGADRLMILRWRRCGRRMARPLAMPCPQIVVAPGLLLGVNRPFQSQHGPGKRRHGFVIKAHQGACNPDGQLRYEFFSQPSGRESAKIVSPIFLSSDRGSRPCQISRPARRAALM